MPWCFKHLSKMKATYTYLLAAISGVSAAYFFSESLAHTEIYLAYRHFTHPQTRLAHVLHALAHFFKCIQARVCEIGHKTVHKQLLLLGYNQLESIWTWPFTSHSFVSEDVIHTHTNTHKIHSRKNEKERRINLFTNCAKQQFQQTAWVMRSKVAECARAHAHDQCMCTSFKCAHTASIRANGALWFHR